MGKHHYNFSNLNVLHDTGNSNSKFTTVRPYVSVTLNTPVNSINFLAPKFLVKSRAVPEPIFSAPAGAGVRNF